MKLIQEGFWKRNKKLFAVSLAIFLIVFIAGAAVSYMNVGDNYGKMSDFMKEQNNASSEAYSGPTATWYFTHNFLANVLIMLGGLILAIPSILITAFNAFSLSMIFGADLTFAAVSVVPHAITEYLAMVFSLLVAFKIAMIEIDMIRKRNFRDTLKEHNIDLHDIVFLFVVVFILILVSAIIEAYFTPMFTEWFFFN